MGESRKHPSGWPCRFVALTGGIAALLSTSVSLGAEGSFFGKLKPGFWNWGQNQQGPNVPAPDTDFLTGAGQSCGEYSMNGLPGLCGLHREKWVELVQQVYQENITRYQAQNSCRLPGGKTLSQNDLDQCDPTWWKVQSKVAKPIQTQLMAGQFPVIAFEMYRDILLNEIQSNSRIVYPKDCLLCDAIVSGYKKRTTADSLPLLKKHMGNATENSDVVLSCNTQSKEDKKVGVGDVCAYRYNTAATRAPAASLMKNWDEQKLSKMNLPQYMCYADVYAKRADIMALHVLRAAFDTVEQRALIESHGHYAYAANTTFNQMMAAGKSAARKHWPKRGKMKRAFIAAQNRKYQEKAAENLTAAKEAFRNDMQEYLTCGTPTQLPAETTPSEASAPAPQGESSLPLAALSLLPLGIPGRRHRRKGTQTDRLAIAVFLFASSALFSSCDQGNVDSIDTTPATPAPTSNTPAMGAAEEMGNVGNDNRTLAGLAGDGSVGNVDGSGNGSTTMSAAKAGDGASPDGSNPGGYPGIENTKSAAFDPLAGLGDSGGGGAAGAGGGAGGMGSGGAGRNVTTAPISGTGTVDPFMASGSGTTDVSGTTYAGGGKGVSGGGYGGAGGLGGLGGLLGGSGADGNGGSGGAMAFGVSHRVGDGDPNAVMTTADPGDAYWTFIKPDESIFKVVERRYGNVAMGWYGSEFSSIRGPASTK